jgi:exosome complex exonuclease DIS3/RRP44
VYTHLSPPGADSPFEFHPSRDELSAGGCVLRMLDRIRVRISVEIGPLLRPRLAIEIVQPRLPDAARPNQTKQSSDGEQNGKGRRGVLFGQRGVARHSGMDGRTGRKGTKRLSAKAERRRPVEFRGSQRGP